MELQISSLTNRFFIQIVNNFHLEDCWDVENNKICFKGCHRFRLGGGLFVGNLNGMCVSL